MCNFSVSIKILQDKGIKNIIRKFFALNVCMFSFILHNNVFKLLLWQNVQRYISKVHLQLTSVQIFSSNYPEKKKFVVLKNPNYHC